MSMASYESGLLSHHEGWNSTHISYSYHRNSEHQRFNAFNTWCKLYTQRFDAWAKLKNTSPSLKIIDYGCGDGKVTAQMAQMIHPIHGHVVGVDCSESMLDIARNKFQPRPVNDQFHNLDFVLDASLTFSANSGEMEDGSANAITSFFTFHLVSEPETTLRSIHRKLQANGDFVACYPIRPSESFGKAMNAAFEEFGFARPRQRDQGLLSMFNVTDASLLLEKTGFVVHEIYIEDGVDYFVDADELVEWCLGTLAANWNIPAEKAKSFFDFLVLKYLETDPCAKTANGYISYGFSMIVLHATKQFEV